ncbi:hypothetical protein LEMLEM_LOCUS4280 [Lemmus lemmus]
MGTQNSQTKQRKSSLSRRRFIEEDRQIYKRETKVKIQGVAWSKRPSSVIPTLRQEDPEFQASLNYMASSRPHSKTYQKSINQ